MALTICGLTLVRLGGRGTDWGSFYAAGTIVRTGHADDLYEPATQIAVQRRIFGDAEYENAFPLPAFVAYAISPLTALSVRASYSIWFTLNTCVLAGLLLAARRGLAAMEARQRFICIAATSISTPVATTLAQGQLDLLVVSAMLGCLVLLSRDHKILAGVVLAAALVKPQFLLGAVLLLALHREWRTLAALGVSGGLLFALPLVFSSPDVIIDQVQLIWSYPASPNEHSVNARMMVNLRGTVASVHESAGPMIWAPPLLIASVATLGLAVSRWIRLPRSHPQAWALALVLPLMYSPHVHFHSLVLLLAASVMFLQAAEDARAPIRITYVVMFHLVVTTLWIVSSASIGLLSLVVLGTFGVFYWRWPKAAPGHEDSSNLDTGPAMYAHQ